MPRLARRLLACATATTLWAGVLGAAAVTTAVVTTAPPAAALDNGLALTPPMGFNDWNAFGCNVDEQLIEQTADYFVSSGLKAAGYTYVNIDDCWMTHSRDAEGRLVPDPVKFPDGIKGTADYVHSKGLKLGIYEDAGTATCAGYPGSLGHESTDARSFADWGVDYLKYDNCNNQSDGSRQDYVNRYTAMRDALAATGRPILFSLCEWGVQNPWEWAGPIGNSWRTTGDINDSWSSMLDIAKANMPLADAAGPGHWNDPDMLEVGNGGMTDTEYRTHFSLWSMMDSPLLIGTDLRKATPATLAILGNKDVIALDQDPLGKQATVLSSDDGRYVLTKPLAGGDRAVALFNSTDRAQRIATTATAAGLPKRGSYAVRDLWQHADRQSAGSLAATVPAHGTVVLRVSAAPAAGAKALLDPPLVDTGVTGGPDHIEPGTSADVDTYVTDLGSLPATRVAVHLDAPAGWTVTPRGGTTAIVLPRGKTLTTPWKVTVPAGTRPGTYALSGTVGYRGPVGGVVTVPLAGGVTVLVPPPSGTSQLSDLDWTSATNGWGPVERDQSNGETAAGDGHPITIGGTVFAKGLGTNAPSTITYYLGGKCSALTTTVGVDDEKDGRGTVEFLVVADGTTVADSGVLTDASGPKQLQAALAGVQNVQLVVTDGGDGNDSDHADWANPQITCA
ncbi:NPCBM/NEW2 domain-containing protein [Actinacidiphila sp. DG2A-62]|uniref:NPCBM/NEW2 domain-containing protein n=1 Tax=Actinacidiphila sp. DG2A-62 TaxID=3108821 RepID=UPI002DBA6146|nr:NPCBM/NEW2 domain-containing protein [Actinacidiphila sp. DG2A-62]MEC3998621.1 NPCBM/NEW2 domain-containing protein [Actinacidiphila sp. DG2A-62]